MRPIVVCLLYFSFMSATAPAESFMDRVEIQIEGLSVLDGVPVFGVEPTWFERTSISTTFFLQSSPFDVVGVSSGASTKYLASDLDGKVYVTDVKDKAAYWAYVRLYNGEPTWKTDLIHSHCTVEWQKTKPEKEFRFVCLSRSSEPKIVKDKDGVERKVYPAVLVRGGNRKLVITRLSKADEYSPSLLAGDRYNIADGRLRVMKGEVWFGPGDFGDESSSTWHFDGQLVVMRHDGKWKFLTADDKGAVSLSEKPKATSLWEFHRPKGEEGISAFIMEQDDGKPLYLAPGDEVVKMKDRNGNEVELRRAILEKNPHRHRIIRFAP